MLTPASNLSATTHAPKELAISTAAGSAVTTITPSTRRNGVRAASTSHSMISASCSRSYCDNTERSRCLAATKRLTGTIARMPCTSNFILATPFSAVSSEMPAQRQFHAANAHRTVQLFLASLHLSSEKILGRVTDQRCGRALGGCQTKAPDEHGRQTFRGLAHQQRGS